MYNKSEIKTEVKINENGSVTMTSRLIINHGFRFRDHEEYIEKREQYEALNKRMLKEYVFGDLKDDLKDMEQYVESETAKEKLKDILEKIDEI